MFVVCFQISQTITSTPQLRNKIVSERQNSYHGYKKIAQKKWLKKRISLSANLLCFVMWIVVSQLLSLLKLVSYRGFGIWYGMKWFRLVMELGLTIYAFISITTKHRAASYFNETGNRNERLTCLEFAELCNLCKNFCCKATIIFLDYLRDDDDDQWLEDQMAFIRITFYCNLKLFALRRDSVGRNSSFTYLEVQADWFLHSFFPPRIFLL